MASKQTEHYKLNQWAAEDRVMRTEFNADNAKIEAALEAQAAAIANCGNCKTMHQHSGAEWSRSATKMPYNTGWSYCVGRSKNWRIPMPPWKSPRTPCGMRHRNYNAVSPPALQPGPRNCFLF